MVGHVDHGKTTLTQALSGKWTDTHSEELRRGISIKLGYADTSFYKCPECEGTEAYGTKRYCRTHKRNRIRTRTVSFVDAPGHETLMAVMLSGAAIMDAAILLIAANERCPQPQTREHLMALETMGLNNFVVVQNKIDVCSAERCRESCREIKQFLANTQLAEAPVIPVSAHHNRNIDVLIEAIDTYLPSPDRRGQEAFQMNVARSFDINRPGTFPTKLIGGVLGGSLSRGTVRLGDEIEIRPGRRKGKEYEPIHTTVASLHTGPYSRKQVRAGGLAAVGTQLDPASTKSDSLLGAVMGKTGTLPPVWDTLRLEVHLLKRVVGSKGGRQEVTEIKTNEPLMLTVGTRTTVGVVGKALSGMMEVRLKLSVCAAIKQRVAISRRVEGRWHLIGFGIIQE